MRYAGVRMSAEKGKLISEMNVIPFIDVLLVLLAIFVITSMNALSMVDVDLPTTGDSAEKAQDFLSPTMILISENGSIVLNDKAIAKEELSEYVDVSSAFNRGRKVFIYADSKANYGVVVDVLGMMNKKGVKVSLVTRAKR